MNSRAGWMRRVWKGSDGDRDGRGLAEEIEGFIDEDRFEGE